MRFTTLILLLFLSTAAMGQAQPAGASKAQLEARRTEIQNDIRETEQQLAALKANKNATMGQLRALQNKLAGRQRLIGNINDELSSIDHSIRSSTKEVLTLKQKLEQLQVRYAQSIRYDYETHSAYGVAAFLFSANDFNDAMRRMRYLKKFREYRRQQVEQIRLTQGLIQHKIGELNEQKKQKDDLLNEQVQEKQKLMADANETNDVVKQLKGQEGKLMKDIEAKRKVTARINAAIAAFIEREMAEAAKKAEEEQKKRDKAALANGTKPNLPVPNKTNTTSPDVTLNRVPVKTKPGKAAPPMLLTPTEVALVSNFEGNKGKLYWPVDKGYISDHFGSHPHPLAPQVIIHNNGIDIQTSANASIRSVFDGTVYNVFSTVGSQQIVMIQHGNYFTIYNGLATVAVKKGQAVTTKQVIGTVATNDEGEPTVNFQIWKSQTALNPEAWIGKAH